MPRNRENRMMQPKRQRRQPVREPGKRERRERSWGGGGWEKEEGRKEGGRENEGGFRRQVSQKRE